MSPSTSTRTRWNEPELGSAFAEGVAIDVGEVLAIGDADGSFDTVFDPGSRLTGLVGDLIGVATKR